MGFQRPRGPRVGIEIDREAFRQARLNAGLSLAQVGGSDLTRQAVHLIETGRARPTRRSLGIIARRLGVPESALLASPGAAADVRVIQELEELCERREYGQAAEQAVALIALGGSEERMAFAHHYAGVALYVPGQPAEALPHLRTARALFEALGNPWWVAESMDWEAIALNMLEEPAALRLAGRALRLYRSLEPRRPETESRMLEHLGTIHFVRRDYESARRRYEDALQVTGGVRDLARIARVYHGLGMCHYEQRRLQPAADLVFKAVTLYEAEQRIASGPARMDMPRAENDLGLVVMAQGDFERAEAFFRSALEHYAEAGIERLLSHTLLSLGELRQRQGRMDEALAYVSQAIERAERLDETFAMTAGHRQLGELHEARGDHALADASFQRALVMCQGAGLEERARTYMYVYEQVLAERRQARRRSRDASA